MAARKLYTAPPAPQDLPICFHPGCGERAPFGYGCTLRTFGRHFCGQHRPERAGFAAEELSPHQDKPVCAS